MHRTENCNIVSLCMNMYVYKFTRNVTASSHIVDYDFKYSPFSSSILNISSCSGDLISECK